MEQQLAEAINIQINKQISAAIPKIRIGRFINFEDTDPGLCAVEIGSVIYRFIPVLASANDMNHGDTCLLIGGQNVPLVMCGTVQGNISSVSDGNASPV